MKKIILAILPALFVFSSLHAQTRNQFSGSGKLVYTKPLHTDGGTDFPAQAGFGLGFSTSFGKEEEIEVSLEISRTEWNRTQTAPASTGLSTAVSKESLTPILLGCSYRLGQQKSKLRPYAGGEIGFTNQTLDATITTPKQPDVTLTSNETKATFGAKGGVQFLVDDSLSVDLGYRYMVVAAASDETAANAASTRSGTSKRDGGDSLSYHVFYLAGSYRF